MHAFLYWCCRLYAPAMSHSSSSFFQTRTLFLESFYVTLYACLCLARESFLSRACSLSKKSNPIFPCPFRSPHRAWMLSTSWQLVCDILMYHCFFHAKVYSQTCARRARNHNQNLYLFGLTCRYVWCRDKLCLLRARADYNLALQSQNDWFRKQRLG